MPSLSSLSNSRQPSSAANSLAQLRQNMQKPTTSSLASLASSSPAEGKKPLSSLQALAQRSNATAKTAPSLASLAVKSPPSTTTEKPLHSLAHLASWQSTPKPNASTGKSALSSLASRQSSATKPASIKPASNLAPAPAPVPVVFATPSVNVDTSKSSSDEEEEDEDAVYENPLYAKPSAAAQFLFKPQQSLQFDAQSVFQQGLKKPTSISVFEFDQPSPDDIVIAAQNQRGGKKL